MEISAAKNNFLLQGVPKAILETFKTFFKVFEAYRNLEQVHEDFVTCIRTCPPAAWK